MRDGRRRGLWHDGGKKRGEIAMKITHMYLTNFSHDV